MTRRDVELVYELSPMQQAMLFSRLSAPGSGVYVVQLRLRLTGRLDVEAFERAWRLLVDRHAVLRTGFYWEDAEKPLQVVYRQVDLEIRRASWLDLDGAAQEERLQAFLDADRERGFDLAEPPLLRLALFDLGPDSWQLVWTQHHLLTDGWSQGLLLAELFTCYEAFVHGRSPALEPARPYREHIAWLQRQDPAAAEAFWRASLAGLAEPTLLAGGDGRPGGQTGFRDSRKRRKKIPAATTAALHERARHGRLTLNTLIQGAWALVLAHTSGRDDVVFGSTVAGRPPQLPGVESIVGLFINTLPVRAQIDPERGVLAWLGELQERQVAARDFEHAPLFEIQTWSELPAGVALFDNVLIFESYPLDGALAGLLPDLTISEVAAHELTSYPVNLVVFPGAELALELVYDAGRVEGIAAVRLLERIEGLLLHLAVGAGSETRLRDLPVLLPGERQQVLVEWNDTESGYPRETTLPELFAAVVHAQPEAPAVVDGEEVWSYRRLDEASSELAGSLAAQGVQPGARVGVSFERSADLVVACLGVLKAGAAYVPLDPGSPEERRAFLKKDTGMTVVLGPSPARPHPPGPPLPSPTQPPGEGGACFGGHCLAYVLYTSGSTGTPKGVAVPHRAIVRLVREAGFLALRPGDRVAFNAHPSFDASTFEIWATLLSGATLVVVPQEVLLAPRELAALLERERITVLHLTAALFAQVAREAPAALPLPRCVLFGGEASAPAAVARALEDGRPQRLLHMYGPTESTTFATWHPVAVVETGSVVVPVGRPIANTTAWIVAPWQDLAPLDAAGELWLGGDGLAWGYLNRPDLTAERFVPDPWSGGPGARLYRTGDLARRRFDGALELLGRIDDQVKIRGFRIEPGEVEAVLVGHPAVREAVVLAREDGAGERRLVAWVVLHRTDSTDRTDRTDDRTDPTGLSAWLRARLPDYMVPSAWVVLDELPLTPNGKVDRRALPAPEVGGAEEHAAPSDPVEELLAGLWAEVLGVDRVGVHEDFFALGGHSLRATQVVSRMQGVLGVELPLRTLFEAPTVAGLARAVRAARQEGSAQAPPLVPVPRMGDLPASFAQQRLWFLDQLEPGSAAYNIPAAVRLTGALSLERLERIFSEVVRRHEALRTTFEDRGGRPVQVVGPLTIQRLSVVDLSCLPEQERESRRLAAEEARRPFDLRRGPLLRLGVVRLGSQDHLLLVTLHHIVSDGWSMGVLLREIAALHEAFAAGRPSPLPELPVQYADFAVWQRSWLTGEVLQTQIDAWKRQLEGAPRVLELPTDRPRPPVQTSRGRTLPVALPAPLAAAVRDLCRREGATPFMVLLAAWAILIGRDAGQEDVLIGTPIAGRNRREIEDLIGFFVNTLVLRVRLDAEEAPSFLDLVANVRQVALDAYAHQDLPFERLVEELAPERDLSRPPLFQVLFAVQNAFGATREIPGLILRPLRIYDLGSKLDLGLTLSETPEGLAGSLEHNTDLFDGSTVARLLARFEALLEAAVRDSEQPLAGLPMLLEGERQQVLVEWNDTESGFPREASLPELFAAVARTQPEAPAVVDGTEVWSYRRLDEASSQLAGSLVAQSVKPGERVGVGFERSADLVVALLGVLKAGAAYVPLDPASPEERLAFLREDAGVAVVLGQGGGAPLPAEGGAMGEGSGVRSGGGEALAYVLYTSGSTGTPKGVAVPHRAIVRLVRETGFLALRPDDRVGFNAHPSFDASTFEIWATLLSGAALVVVPQEILLAPRELAAFVERERITVLHLTAALFAQVAREVPEALSAPRCVLFGGEASAPAAVARALEEGRPQRLLHMYGPTESTTFATWQHIRELPPGAPVVPIGRPLANTTAFVVDLRQGLAPLGATGELWLGGDGLAWGYLNRPELTAERFVPDPWSGAPGARLYRTGDLARRRPDVLELLGRSDDQVKIRGFRIEPGEVEAVLAGHPAVRDGVVLGRENGAGERRLVAWVVLHRTDRTDRTDDRTDPTALASWLRARLPEYMVPSAWVFLDELPLTPNGKVDRRALPAPERAEGTNSEAPSDPLEELLAGVWVEVLGLDRVGVHDDFFAFGGHSLLATRVVSRIRSVLGVELPLRSLFEAPTVAALARLVRAARQDGPIQAPPLVPALRTDDLPASFAQQRLWFLDRLEPGGSVYNLPAAVRCTGRLRAAELAAGLRAVTGRHEALRTTFRESGATGGAPVQVIAPPAGVPLPVIDLAGLPGEAREREAGRLAAEEGRRPFDLERGPLLRAALLRLGPDESDLLLTLHHIVSDAWSMEIFTRELAAAYGALCRGEAPDLPPLSLQYADYAVWQRAWLAGEGLEREAGWWRERLAGAPTALDLPMDRPRPPRPSFRGAAAPVSPLSRDLEAFSRERGVTLFMTLLAAWAALLGRSAGVEDLLLGTPIAGRNRTEIEGLIGFFVNLLVLRIDLGGDPPFSELLRRVREATLDAYAHQDLPFETLVEVIQPERDASRPPLIQVVLALQNAPAVRLELPEVVLAPRPLTTGTAKFDLVLSLAAGGTGLAGSLEHDRDLFDGTTARRMIGSWQALLAGAVARPESRLSDLPWLSEAERHQILVEWSCPEEAAAPLPALHERFQARAAEAPETVAVSASDAWITYGELARRAHRLAWRLRALGVGPEVRVGLQMERSAELVVGLLAILEAGGAYVPLDPELPEERRSWIAQDAFRGIAAPVVVTAALVNDPSLELEPDDPPPSFTESGHAAYVIYTSGSTGRPKGVVVTHGNAARLFEATRPWFGFGPDDVWTLFHSFAFDFSVWEIWGALAHGGRLVLVPREVAVSPESFGELLARERVSVLNQTPSAFRQLVTAEAAGRLPRDLALRLVIFGGEALDPAHLIPWVRSRGDASARLVNMYGITETTVHVTGRTIRRADLESAGRSPVGRPIPDLRLHLVDRWLAPVPAGVPGEILVGGPGLARGYLHRPDLTAERFVPDLFGPPGERLYRSGDLARFRPDGDLEYLGRADHQVKIRGYRIEPAEVEAALAAHPAVDEAVVVAREDRAGDRRLVGYVVFARTDRTDRTDPTDDPTDQTIALAAWLRERLPVYMVPSAFVRLDALPLTAHGKLDRRSLPPPAERPELQEGYAAPSDPLEEALAAVFAEVLGVSRIGVRDGFFEAGGHSLLATRVISRVRETLGVDVPLRALFDSPTVAGLAAAVRPLLESAGVETDRLGPSPLRAAGGPFPLSFSQERLWFLDQLDPGTPAFNIPFAIRLRGRLAPDVLERALAGIVRRHEALRTRFPAVEGRAVQEILPPAPRSLPRVDLAGLPEPRRGAEEERLTRAASEQRLDLARGPLLTALLLRRAEDDQRLVLVVHHIVADGWSMTVLWRELAALYGAFAAGERSPLPPLPLQYADFADWQRRRLAGERLEGQLAWWRERLAGVPVLELRGDRPRPPVQTFRGGHVDLRLPAELVARLTVLAHAAGGSLFMALLAGFEALLGRWSGQTGFAVGTFIANRHRAELEGLIGFFVNNLALRADLSGEPGFGELLRRAREVTLGAYAHQDIPFEKLLEELRPERDMSRPSLFQTMCVLQNVPREKVSLPGLTMTASGVDVHRANFDLTLWMVEDGGEIAAVLDFNADLFDAPTIARLAGHLRRLLESGAAEPDCPVTELPFLDEGERWQLLEWRGAPALWDAEVRVHDLILRQAERTPEALAVVSPATGERLTYGELAKRSAALAGRLRALGVGPEVPVAICLERTAHLIVAVLATLRAGGCYVPLDPAFSEERRAFLLEDSGACVIITAEGERAIGSSTAGGEGSLAYIVYTSGSTGRPKGVLVEHHSLANAYFAWEDAYGLRGAAAGAVHLQMAAFTFDVFSGDFVRALCSGGTLVLCPRETLLDPPRLLELMHSEKVTAAEFVPAVVRGLQEVLERDGGTLDFMRLLIVGSDLWSVGEMRALARFCGPRTRLIDSYGASEATIDTTFFEPSPAAGRLAAEGPVPVGRPFRGSEVYVVDAGLAPLPVGVAGELVIGGSGVARGYVGRPDLTAERFVPHPLAPAPGARLYRTGDLVRWLPEGNLEILGRVDDQVKVRGHRIEPGEVEAVLAEHPRVRQAAVVAVPERTGEKRLVGWVVFHRTDSTDRTDRTDDRTDLTVLSSWLRQKLPDFMVPTAWGVLDELPLNTSGKVDRRALRERPAGWVASEDTAPPRGPVAELLAAIWADLLGLEAERLGARDDFFSLGGHSLLATRLVSRVRDAFGIDLPLVRVFEFPSLEALAGRIEEMLASGRAPLPPIRPVSRDGGGLPLSFSQERLWFLDRLEPGGAAYNIPLPLALRGPLVIPALQAALGEVVRRHESLRTTFAERGGAPVQVIAPPRGRFSLPVVDLTALPEVLRFPETRRLAIEEALRPFDLERGPLFRATLVRAAGDEHAMLLDMHHAVSDLWSLGVLVREVSLLYEAARTGRPSPLPDLPVQYADFAVWQRERLRGDALERQAEHWRRRLAGAPALDLPTDRPRPPVQSFRGSSVSAALGGEGALALQTLGRRHGATLFMTLLAGFAAYLRRITRQADLVVGTPIAGRQVLEVEPLIGFFVNSLVLRIELPGGPEGDPTVAELIAAARRVALDAFTHQDLPFERLVEELRPERHLSHNPLFQVMFTLQNAPLGPLAVPDLSLAPLEVAPPTAKFDLGATFTEVRDGLGIALDYAIDLFDAPAVQRMAGHLTTLLSSLDPVRRISELPLLAEAERHQLLEHNDAPEELEPAGVVEELAARFARTPGETALVCGGEVLTCGALDRRSAAVARRLRTLGAGPGARVGLLADRTPALVVGLLGILRAGGAFLALDPAHPAPRLSFLLEDSDACLVLGEERWRALLPEGGIRFVSLDEEGEAAAADLPLPAPHGLAYLLYTSGTTGRPKAVLVEHRHLAATLAAARRRLGLAPGVRMPCVAPFTFDIFLFELLAPLLAGGAVTLVSLRPVLDVDDLAGSLAGLTAFHAVPALMRRVVDAVRRRPEDGRSLRQVFVGGDAVPPELLVDLREVFPQAQVWVLYGPTETTILASAHPVSATGLARPLLGRPLGRATLHVRDTHGREVPSGVLGEIWIGGPTVARGYWRRDELTAERFVEEGGGRFFRTGDLARRLPDGTLEFFGRIDEQVKVRGFRIEPGEVEGVLARHSEVDQVVVGADADSEGSKRLVAWVVRRRSPGGDAELAAEQVASWQTLYDETYAGSRAPEDSTFDIEGWNSSYTGAPIPAEEMHAWVESAVERVRALGGGRILEIGCGTGLLLFRLAPHVDRYHGTDISAVALGGIRRRLHLLGDAAARVTLERATADDWSGISPGDFDTVVLSSVVQYFPGIDYLARVLEVAVSRLSPGGAVFVGDVRSLPLLEMFHTSVELSRAPGDLPSAELRRRVRRAIAAEEELVIDPAFFHALAHRLPAIRGVEVLPQRGPFDNEMTLYRYDVVLRVGAVPVSAAAEPLRRLANLGALANDPLRARAAQRLVPELRRFAQAELPEYMVPSAFVLLDELPLTTHGKVDREALPPPDPGRQAAGTDFVPPRTPQEETVAQIWAELLSIEQIGAHDDFFALGGHSLLATQLVSRLRDRCGVDLPVRAVFEKPTVALLAEALQVTPVHEIGEAPPLPPIIRVPRDGDLPLSFAQQRLWFLDQLEPGHPVYIIPSPVRLTGDVAPRDLARIFAEVVRRHEALRTTFDIRKGRPVQVIAPPASAPALPLVDLSGLPAPEDEARSLARDDARRPFDLRRGPLLRLCLVRLAERDHVLLMTMHHIVSDGWSMGVLLRELGLLYEAFAQGRPSPLPELPVQYADFAHWQRAWLRGEVLEDQLAYWRQELAGAPRVLEMPLDRPRPAVQSWHGAEQSVPLPPELSAAVHALCRREGATPFMVLLAAWGLLLGRHAGQEDVLLGTPIAGRNRREIESLIGFFVNTLVMRVDLQEAPGFAELVRRVRRAALDAYAHQDVPFERVVEELVPERDLSRPPLFQAMFVLQNAPRQPLSLPGLTLAPIGLQNEAAAVDLTLTFTEGADGFAATIEHNTDLFDRSTASRILARFKALLAAAVGDPGRSLRDLPLMLPGERHQALVEWNDAATAYPRDACLAELFEAVARDLPDAPAVIGAAGEVWSYRRLDAATNRLARRLRALGVGPETAVGISMERSPELIAGILAIVKAGGFYVPLDPGYPDERLDFMLADTRAAVVLVNARTRERLEGRAPLLAVEDLEDLEEAAGPLGIRVPAESIAYVIFTSGSTGTPKGSAVPQRGVVRLVRETNYVRLGPGDRVGHASNISFDSATYEIWGALLNGGTLVVIPREVVLSPVDFAAWIRERQVNSLTLTTALFHRIAREVPDAFAPLREFLPGGEAMDPAVVRAVLAAGPPGCLINGYGPTESTTLASWQPLREMPADAVTVPIGRPLANTTLYVLDPSFAAVPPGVAGELCLGGDGLARGYLNQPELTAEKFVPDGFGGAPGARLYRTGDLARWRSRGELEYLGRIDHQVKVRGFRVEPGEIEAALTQLPNVRAAVVLVREDAPGDRRLVAYVLARQKPAPAVEEMRAGLKERLPEYMIPAVFVPLESLPLTPNGKVDRSALPRIDGRRPDLRADPVAPRTPLEEVLAGLWAEILGLAEVGVEDDFFALGGHSLLATQLLSAVRDAFDVEIPVQSLFERRTVAGMAEALLEVAGDPLRVERTAELLLEVASLSDEEVDVVLGEAGP